MAGVVTEVPAPASDLASQFDSQEGLTPGEQSAQLNVLVVDDDGSVRNACREIARNLGHQTHVAESVPTARAVLKGESIDVLLLDLKLPGGGGLALLEEVKSLYPDTVVVVMTAFATVNSAVEAMRIGASDYLTKPFAMDELTAMLERAAERRNFDAEARRLRGRLRTQQGFGTIVGRSPEMDRLYRILSKVAFAGHPVLILGESGTGKEMVARAIHTNGPNAARPFIPVDCGSLLPAMVESELFGYVKGAFPGAVKAKTGLLAAADGGTIFLDEISELPLDLQAKLLRALQQKEIRPLGSSDRPEDRVPINVRILAATNRDLAQMVERGQFRKDLFFRLNVVTLRVPPLRERKQDIPLLAAHFIERVSKQSGTSYTLSDDALRTMVDYDWPGNVRELENAIERAFTLSSGPMLHMGDLPTQLQDFRMHQRVVHEERAEAAVAARPGGVRTIAELEKQAILDAIVHLNGDKLKAAKLLGIGKTTLYRKLKEYGISETYA